MSARRKSVRRMRRDILPSVASMFCACLLVLCIHQDPWQLCVIALCGCGVVSLFFYGMTAVVAYRRGTVD